MSVYKGPSQCGDGYLVVAYYVTCETGFDDKTKKFQNHLESKTELPEM